MHLYTWNPNGAPCFGWSLGLVFGGLTFKNRGKIGVLGMYIYITGSEVRSMDRQHHTKLLLQGSSQKRVVRVETPQMNPYPKKNNLG